MGTRHILPGCVQVNQQVMCMHLAQRLVPVGPMSVSTSLTINRLWKLRHVLEPDCWKTVSPKACTGTQAQVWG